MNFKKFNVIEHGITWLHEKTNEKQFLIFSSILVGVTAGIAAVILKSIVYAIRRLILDYQIPSFSYPFLYLLLPIFGIGLCVLLVKYSFKGQVNKGAFPILYSIAKKGSYLPFSQMYSHIFTSALTVGFGGSAGLESPIVSTGSAIGSNFGRTYKLNYKDRTLLLAAGAAGG
ncbi:MAG TPA: chloride channel protein, partial [Bacteroidia bacterium]|nr:chloride channel protein [Bacteroidia bacterium]